MNLLFMIHVYKQACNCKTIQKSFNIKSLTTLDFGQQVLQFHCQMGNWKTGIMKTGFYKNLNFTTKVRDQQLSSGTAFILVLF